MILEKMWWTGGTVAVPLVLEGFDNLWDGGTLNLKRSLRNVGDIHFVGGKLVFGGNVRLLNEGGIWVGGATSAFVNSQANNMFENRGALLIGAAVAAFTTNVPFENSEDIYLASTVTLRVNNTFQHSGWISFGGNSKVRMTGQTTVFSFTTHPLAVGSTCQFVVEGSASFIVDGGLGQNCHFEVTAGRWQVNAPVSVGTVNFSNGRIEGSGSLTTRKLEWSGGRLQVPTTLDWLGGDFNGGSGYLEALLTNNSNFNLYSGNLLLAAQGKIVNNGVFNHIGADASVNRSGAQVAQVVENHNLYRKTGAVTGAAAKFGVPVVNTPTGEMHGIGTVRFLSGLAQNGTFSPGLDSAAGTFRVEPTWTNNANLSFTIVRHGSDTATTHDKMEVQGQTLLSGSLVVTEVGTVPDGSFDIISCGTPTCPNCLSGTFSSLDLPTGYTVQYMGKKVRLVKNTMLADRSGVLDRADGPASAAEGTATVHVSPNPFEAQAQVSLVLQKEMLVRVAVFDATGREVCVLQERAWLGAGLHAFDWRPEGDAHGAFWVRVEGEGFDQTRRIVRIKR